MDKRKNNKFKKSKNFKRKFNNDHGDGHNDNDVQQQNSGGQLIETGENEQPLTTIEDYDHDNPDSLKNMTNSNDKIFNPKRFRNVTNQSKRLIIILERANLEIVKNKEKFELLNTDDHQNLIKKFKKDPMFCRPDILHQCLLMLFDSPLNRAGLLQVYVHSEQNVLIEINPQTRVPRTFKRFAFLMVQLLHKLSVRASNSSDKLMRVIKNPITLHLPVGCRRIGTTFKSANLVKPKELVPNDNQPIAIVIGAMAHGNVEVDYTESDVSISQYPLSAALACTKICSAFEEAWEIF
ncbi:ribosomal RNA small subunit methyltransferase NEP1 [Dermatophagoides pteronyssinus]|uniref:18S rRNA (pseudouridine-N1)-methyltransferase n=1 Tax=Dermatophagoides pteronyssinus TaxID=6956 RepID=A0A6P6YBU0_DERPT|nr:ribosomal RNA small subunit methyltransferase NEP1-like [Dermatophagoides pteronyssinus]